MTLHCESPVTYTPSSKEKYTTISAPLYNIFIRDRKLLSVINSISILIVSSKISDFQKTFTDMRKISVYVDGACKGNPGRGGWGCHAIHHPKESEALPDHPKESEALPDHPKESEALPDHPIPSSDSPGPTIIWSQYGGKKHTTNNEMELSGFLKGLRLSMTRSDITIYADTQYGLKGLLNSSGSSKEYLNGSINKNKLGNDVVFTGWVKGWSNNGWKTKANKPVANKQLWMDIMFECKRHVLSGSVLHFIWVKGHSGNPGNEIADSLANLGAAMYV
jgi:ribonuclease HI